MSEADNTDMIHHLTHTLLKVIEEAPAALTVHEALCALLGCMVALIREHTTCPDTAGMPYVMALAQNLGMETSVLRGLDMAGK